MTLTLPPLGMGCAGIGNLYRAVDEATADATVAAASIQLRLKDEEGAKKKLDECEKILDGFDSVETVVHANYYKASAQYYQVTHPIPTPSYQAIPTYPY